MASDDQVINSISQSLADLERTLTRFVAKTEASTKKFDDSMKRMGSSAKKAGTDVATGFKAAEAASSGMRGTSSAAANLSFQLNDIGMMMASGQNPFMLMIQQGSQVSQIMGEITRQGGSLGQVVRGAFSQLLNPLGLVSMALIGLSAYAVSFFTEWVSGAEDAEDATKKLLEATNSLRAAQGLKGVDLDETEVNKFLKLREAIAANRTTAALLAEALNEVKDEILGVPADAFGGQTKTIKDIDSALSALQEGLKNGNVDFLEFAKTMAEIESRGNVPKVIQDLVTKVVDLAAKGAATHEIIQELNKAINGTALNAKLAADAVELYGKSLDGIDSFAANAGKVWTNYWGDFKEGVDGANSAIDSMIARIRKAEGTAKNPRSSAVGEGQFINSTWLAMVKKYAPAEAAGLSDAGILELRQNSELAIQMIRRYAEENAKSLTLAGQAASEQNLQLAHFLGPKGALDILQAAPGTPVSQILGADAIRANPEVLGGGKLREDVLAYAAARAGATVAEKEHKSAVDALMVSMNQQLESQARQNAINGDTTKTIDEKTFALLKEENMTKLLNAAQADGVTVTTEQQAAFDALATKMAQAGLSAEQLKQKQAELDKQTAQSTQKAEALAQQYNQMASQAISGFINDLRHGVSAGEAFSKMLDTLIGQLIEMAVQAMVMKSGLGTALAGLGGGTGILGFKSGGTIGFTGNAKSTVSGRSFAGAQSMASGGIMGDPNAIPIIGHRGEIVIPTDALRKAATSTRQPQQTSIDARSTVNVDIANGTGTTNVTSQGGVNFASMLDRAVQGIIVRESRPGGLLRGGMLGERR